MSKTLLIRYGYKDDFRKINLHVREFGFTIDTDELYLGTSKGNVLILDEEAVESRISDSLFKYKIKAASSNDLSSSILSGEMMFDKDIGRIKFLNPTNNFLQTYTTTSDLPAKESTTVKIKDDDIDHDDNDSVTFTGFNRPMVLAFYNGSLITDHDDDPHTYTYDKDAKTLKISNCSEDDLISFF